MLSQLEAIEKAVAAGNSTQAVRRLENLRRTVDGCPDTATAGEVRDRNDWIVDCDAQREIRTLIDVLISNLSG